MAWALYPTPMATLDATLGLSGFTSIDEVLPDAFGPRQLAEYRGAGA